MSEHPYNLVGQHLKKLSALGLAVDALGVWVEHSGCGIDPEGLIQIGMMIRSQARKAEELLLKWGEEKDDPGSPDKVSASMS